MSATIPDALADAEVRLLLAAVRNPDHRCCFSLMYACGLRISEAASLHVDAIDHPRMVLRIIGKGNKERLVPLPQRSSTSWSSCGGNTATDSGCFPITTAPSRSPAPCCRGASRPRSRRSACHAGQRRTPCAIVTRHGCWRMASTPVLLGMPISRPQPSIGDVVSLANDHQASFRCRRPR